jgi:hypothetical protein
LEVFQLFGLFLAVLVLNDGLNVFVVLSFFDFLFKFSIKLRQLYLLEVLLTNSQFLLSMLLSNILSNFLALFWTKVRLGIEIL